MQIRKSVADRIKENPAQGLPLLLDEIKRVLDEPRLPRWLSVIRVFETASSANQGRLWLVG
jgi:hypothetical protein